MEVQEPQGHRVALCGRQACRSLTPRCGEPKERETSGPGRARPTREPVPASALLCPAAPLTAVTALTRTSCSGERSVRPLPGAPRSGQGWLVAACARAGQRLSAPGHRHRLQTGCNSQESCTELGAAQPQVSGAGRRRRGSEGGGARSARREACLLKWRCSAVSRLGPIGWVALEMGNLEVGSGNKKVERGGRNGKFGVLTFQGSLLAPLTLPRFPALCKMGMGVRWRSRVRGSVEN